MLQAKPGQVFQRSDLESRHVLRVSVGYPSHPEHIAKGAEPISWCEFPIREVARVTIDQDPGLARETCPYGVVTRRDGYSPQFFHGILRFHSDKNVEVPLTFGDQPVNVGAAVLSAAALSAEGIDLPAGVPQPRSALEKVGVTHVDLTPFRWDGALGTTRSIEISKVSEAMLGENGYVVLVDSTTQLHGDVRAKVPNMSLRLGEAAEQIAARGRKPRSDEVAYHQGENKALRHVGQLLGIAGPCTYASVSSKLRSLLSRLKELESMELASRREERGLPSGDQSLVCELVQAITEPLLPGQVLKRNLTQAEYARWLEELLKDKVVVIKRSSVGSVSETTARIYGPDQPPTRTIGFNCAGEARPADLESVPGGFAAQVTQTVRNRGSDYGHPSTNHQLTADLWSAYLSRRLGKEVRVTAEDVCMLNVLQKSSRLADGTKDDSWLDIAGYTENVAMLRPDQRNRRNT